MSGNDVTRILSRNMLPVLSKTGWFLFSSIKYCLHTHTYTHTLTCTQLHTVTGTHALIFIIQQKTLIGTMDDYGSFSVYTKACSMNYLLGTYKYNVGSFKLYTCNYCQFFCFTDDETEARALNHLFNNWVI